MIFFPLIRGEEGTLGDWDWDVGVTCRVLLCGCDWKARRVPRAGHTRHWEVVVAVTHRQ